VIDHGALPLTVLDQVIGDWIEAERTGIRRGGL
jgi:hypothetical protein